MKNRFKKIKNTYLSCVEINTSSLWLGLVVLIILSSCSSENNIHYYIPNIEKVMTELYIQIDGYISEVLGIINYTVCFIGEAFEI